MPSFSCDLSQTSVPFEHFSEHSVGSDHAPIDLLPHGLAAITLEFEAKAFTKITEKRREV